MSDENKRHGSAGFAPSPLTYEAQAELNAAGKMIAEYVASVSSHERARPANRCRHLRSREGLRCHRLYVAAPVTALSLSFNAHIEHDCGVTLFQHACKMGLEGIVSSASDRATDPAGRRTGSSSRIRRRRP